MRSRRSRTRSPGSCGPPARARAPSARRRRFLPALEAPAEHGGVHRQASSSSDEPAITPPDPRRGKSSPGSHSSSPALRCGPRRRRRSRSGVVDRAQLSALDLRRAFTSSPWPCAPRGRRPGRGPRAPRRAVERTQRVELLPCRGHARLAHGPEAVHRRSSHLAADPQVRASTPPRSTSSEIDPARAEATLEPRHEFAAGGRVTPVPRPARSASPSKRIVAPTAAEARPGRRRRWRPPGGHRSSCPYGA